jgi:hypothetical protein
MLAFLEKFLLAILASLVFYAITGQLKNARGETVGGWRRTAVVLGAGLLAVLAAVFADRLQSNTSIKGRPSTAQMPSTEAPPTKTAPASASPISSASTRVGSQSAGGGGGNPEDEFVSKYLAPNEASRHAGGWTVLISSASRTDFPALYAAAEDALSEKGYAVRPLFRAALLHDTAAYDELYAGNPALLKRIGTYRDGVLVGKLRSEVSQNTSLDMFTAHLFADVRVISARSAEVGGQFTIDETGAGFSEAAATTAAEHRLADKLKQQLLQAIPSK